MGGRPIMRAAMRKIDEQGGEDLFDQLAGGMTMTALVKKIGVSKRVFYKWLRSVEGREEKYYEARRRWADTLAEETLEIADGAIDAHDAQVRKLRIDTRKWLAARANPDNWGERRDPLLSINIQDQHLVALRELIQPEDSIVSDQ
jgi:AcrR family transcriptional regulator